MNRTFANAACVALMGLGIGAATVPACAEDKKPPSWWDTFAWSGYVDAGITANPDDPSNGINFGHLYTDRSNMPVLNQASIILTRPLDPKAVGPDVGFTFQGMFGTDARYTHLYNQGDRIINSRYQFDIVEADMLVHLPLFTEGGMDIKAGQYPTPIGFEVINRGGNPLYSHSYIYNFGIPIKHTGLLTTTHISPIVDFYMGADTGNLGWVGEKGMANDTYFHFLGGLGFNLLEGNLTVLALTHIGPENSDLIGLSKPNSTNRFINDVVITLKVNEDLTFVTELNYIKDDLIIPGVLNQPDAYGISLYGTYVFNDMFTLQARGEVWRDNNGFFAAAFPGNFDFTNLGRGLPNTAFNGGKATYEEVTLGVNISPPGLPEMFKGFKIRPEVRYDHAEQARPFNSLRSDHQFTIAADIFLPF
jgi:hypothetical protein